ncbi:MAG: hypothetical protein ACRCXD_13080 [Luteolibacter sp.]
MLQDVTNMSLQNPYSPPQVIDSLAPIGNLQFGDLDDKALNKLYYRSCNVTGIAVLLSFGVVVMAGVVAMPEADLDGLPKWVFIGLALFYVIAIIGLLKRSSWGRIMGILVCILSLISIPLGTIIGVVGLFAFIKAPNLFGRGRVLHKDLKAEFKLRKKAKKTAGTRR